MLILSYSLNCFWIEVESPLLIQCSIPSASSSLSPDKQSFSDFETCYLSKWLFLLLTIGFKTLIPSISISLSKWVEEAEVGWIAQTSLTIPIVCIKYNYISLIPKFIMQTISPFSFQVQYYGLILIHLGDYCGTQAREHDLFLQLDYLVQQVNKLLI